MGSPPSGGERSGSSIRRQQNVLLPLVTLRVPAPTRLIPLVLREVSDPRAIIASNGLARKES